MISKRRAQQLDKYFYSDHAARARTTFLNLIVGSVVLLLGVEHNVSRIISLSAAAVAMIAVVMLRLKLYKAPIDRVVGLDRRDRTKLSYKTIFVAAFSLDRRSFLASVPVGIAAMIWLIVGLPDTTEAEAIHRRLRVLVEDGELSSAQKLAHQAARAGIPLEPDVLGLIGTLIPLDRSGNLILPDMSSIYPRSPDNRAAVLLENGQLLSIWLPVVHIPKGTYRLTGTLNGRFGSITGDGASLTHLGIDSGSDAAGPLVKYRQGMRADVLIFALTVFSVRQEKGDKFLELEAGVAKIAVLDVVLRALTQTLDQVLWNRVQFENCSVVCSGEKLNLSNVQFKSCDFTFVSNVPTWIVEKLRTSYGEPISISWG